MDVEQTTSTLRLMNDMTLFNSPLSQAQIKAEVQALVTQTVQIGPVQNQGGNVGGNTSTATGSGGSTFANTSNTSLGRIQSSDGGSSLAQASTKAGTMNFGEQSQATGVGLSGVGDLGQPT